MSNIEPYTITKTAVKIEIVVSDYAVGDNVKLATIMFLDENGIAIRVERLDVSESLVGEDLINDVCTRLNIIRV